MADSINIFTSIFFRNIIQLFDRCETGGISMPIFMQYDGILGLATGKRKGWIELESCQWEQNRDVTNRSRRIEGIRAPSSSEIVVTHFQDAISPQLFRESIEGTRKKATIEFGNEPDPGHLQMYLRIELVNTMISSISSS